MSKFGRRYPTMKDINSPRKIPYWNTTKGNIWDENAELANAKYCEIIGEGSVKPAFPKEKKCKGRGRTFKKDPVATAAAGFLDKRSYKSFHIHSTTGQPCQFLKGKDVEAIRWKIYCRDEGRCQLRIECDGLLTLPYEGEWWKRAHLEHEKGGSASQRCFCEQNLRISCPACNFAKHGREPRFGVDRDYHKT